ncbi:uncharacterized protein METZ01_LOCUS450713, partial [marine metagenome]
VRRQINHQATAPIKALPSTIPALANNAARTWPNTSPSPSILCNFRTKTLLDNRKSNTGAAIEIYASVPANDGTVCAAHTEDKTDRKEHHHARRYHEVDNLQRQQPLGLKLRREQFFYSLSFHQSLQLPAFPSDL